MVWHAPEHVGPTYDAIPPEIINQILNVIVVADLMFGNGLSFLLSISWNITLITVSYMPSCTVVDLQKGMMQIALVCHWQGLSVTPALVDNQFDPLWDTIGNVNLNVTAAAEHTPEIECCIRMIKERFVPETVVCLLLHFLLGLLLD